MGRHYSFLAYSASQLRDHSVWMVSAGPAAGRAESERLAATMRGWMGDAMETQRVPAKCAARLGQCFSTTVDAAAVSGEEDVSTGGLAVFLQASKGHTPAPRAADKCFVKRTLLPEAGPCRHPRIAAA